MLVAGDREVGRGDRCRAEPFWRETSAHGRSTLHGGRAREESHVGSAKPVSRGSRRTLSHSIARPDVMTAFAPTSASGFVKSG